MLGHVPIFHHLFWVVTVSSAYAMKFFWLWCRRRYSRFGESVCLRMQGSIMHFFFTPRIPFLYLRCRITVAVGVLIELYDDALSDAYVVYKSDYCEWSVGKNTARWQRLWHVVTFQRSVVTFMYHLRGRQEGENFACAPSLWISSDSVKSDFPTRH